MNSNSFKELVKLCEELRENRPPKPVVMFSDFVEEDACFVGDKVNEMLGCNDDEKGFLMCSSLRERVEKLGDMVKIIDRPNPNFTPFKDMKWEVKEPDWFRRGEG